MKSKRKFSLEFKRTLVEEIKTGVLSMAQAIRQHELGYTLIYGWMNRYEREKLNNEPTEAGAMKNKIAEKDPEWEKRLLARIEGILIEFERYGYRRVTKQLHREGWTVNRKGGGNTSHHLCLTYSSSS